MTWFWAALHEQFPTAPVALGKVIAWTAGDPDELRGLDQDGLAEAFGPKTASKIQAANSLYEAQPDKFAALEDRGVECLTRFDRRFPPGVAEAPVNIPILYTLGDLSLLEGPGVGICGSRDASPAALQRAREFGRAAAETELPVISGYARGVDTESHIGTLERGGRTVAVLAEGIAQFRHRKVFGSELDDVSDSVPNGFLAVSQFPPFERWHSYNAMSRNKVICALADGVVVVEASDRGGTISAGRECLAQHKPLWVMEYEDNANAEGNRLLLDEGGNPVRSAEELGAVLRIIEELPRTGRRRKGADASQIMMI